MFINILFSLSKCSVKCGSGWRLRRFECRNTRTNESVENKCKSESKPAYYEQCSAPVECPHWQYGSWSACSNECGEGVRRRLVVCLSADGLVTPDSDCTSSSQQQQQQRPDDYQKCFGQSSCSRWTTSLWSDCDFKTCTKVRTVVCAHENGTRLNENECIRNDKPNYIAECDSRASCKHYQNSIGGLSSHQMSNNSMTSVFSLGYVHYTQWSSCSSKCGPGWRSRRAICKSLSNDSQELDMRYCSGSSSSNGGGEPTRMACDVAQCFYKIIETWSQCSSSCGQQGRETLERRCYESVTKQFVDTAYCGLSNATKIVTRTCYRPCVRHVRNTFEWRASDWKSVRHFHL